ncbi:MAG TPA: serine hydrolase domain-containing protein [Thermoanaerobaculia bacterium]|nr:serine hydrolase domain-containing protein [Thermoanaerobaculia bacterium]
MIPTLLSLLLALAPSPLDDATAPAPAPPFEPAALEQAMHVHFTARFADWHVPGGAFALVHGDRVLVLAGFGLADLEAATPVDPEATVFRVGSNSKPVTAIAALQQIEAGRLDLHTDVSGVLGWEIPRSFDQPITLHHLLTHTSGLAEELLSQHVRRPEHLRSLGEYLRAELPRRAQPPGRVISYNDHGTALAGLLVERATGEPFAESVRRTLFEPLDMTRSSFEQVALPADLTRHLAKAYRWDGAAHHALARDYVITTPAAGLYTTAADMARFLSALIGGGQLAGQRVLSPEGVETLLETQFRHGEGMPGRAYGWVEGTLAGRRLLSKDGQCSGFTARLAIVPEEDLAWFSVVNLSIFGPAGAFQPVARFHRELTQVIGDQLAPLPATDAPPPTVSQPELAPIASPTPLARLAGVYRDTSDPRDTWESLLIRNELEVSAGEQGLEVFGLSPWLEVAPLTFRDREQSAGTLLFKEDDAGVVRWVTYGAGAWERVPWWRTAHVTTIAAAGLAVSLSIALAASVVATRRARRAGRKRDAGMLPAAASALLLLLFAVAWGLSLLLTDVQVLFSGPTTAQRALLALPLLALALAAVSLARVLARLRETTQPARLLWPTALATLSLATIAFLGSWNLLGWRI